ncbi:MAG: GNAT family N-acetyltransferase [Clostridium sp.]
MLILKSVTVEEIEYQVTLSDDSQALQAAYAAGGAIIGIWNETWQKGDGLASCLYLVTDPEDVDGRMLERVVRRRFNMPWRIGETKRLFIREFKKEDPLEAESEGSAGSELPIFCDKSRRDAYIDSQYCFHECGLWALEDKDTGMLVGKAGVTDGELGYHIYRPFRGQGYALEACREILKYAEKEMQLQEIFLRIQRDNQPSIGLANRLGFKIIREEQDILIYACVFNV